MLKLIEGEAYLYGGVVYLAKGYQHPEGLVVAYPRYSALQRRKLRDYEKPLHAKVQWWDCIKREVPLLPLEKVHLYNGPATLQSALYIKELLESLLERELYVTGSALVCEEFNDVDLVSYGADEETVERLKGLFEKGVLERHLPLLIKEYSLRHSGKLSLHEYLRVKKETVLHGYYKGVHVNLKLVELRRGYNYCFDPVEEVTSYTGYVEVVKALNPHLIPARYLARVGGREVLLETLRELYAELEPGFYYAVDAKFENRKSGLYLVPDHGVLKPLH